MSPRLARSLFGLHIVALLVSMQISNAWRNGLEQSLNVAFPFLSWVHFGMFCGLSLLLPSQLACPARWVLLLALLTKALRFLPLIVIRV